MRPEVRAEIMRYLSFINDDLKEGNNSESETASEMGELLSGKKAKK